MKKLFSTLLLLPVIALSFSSCTLNEKEETVIQTNNEVQQTENTKPIVIPTVKASSFATYTEDKLSYTPKVPAYSGKIVQNPNLYIRPEVQELLDKKYFAIDANDYREEYYEIYEDNRYNVVPNFITTDSALHTYHLFFNYLLEDLENKELYAALEKFTDSMITISRKQMEESKGTELTKIAETNLAYFIVAKKLLNSNYEIPVSVKEKVESELALIKAASGIQESNILGTEDDVYREDYSQYIPRGHYTKSDSLTRYFKSMMWYGRLTFRLKNLDETKSSLLIVSGIGTDSATEKLWNTIYEPINFFVGEPDDLSFYDYSELAKTIFGGLELQEIAAQGDKGIADFMAAGKLLRDPKINSMPILAPFLVPNDRDVETKGFRVFGQRSTVDAMIFQKLIYRDVDKNPQGDLRMLPKALDIPAVFGSEDAFEILVKEGDTEYEKYKDNFKKLKTAIAEYKVEDWGQNLYWAWMYSLKALTTQYGEGYPDFMRNSNWKLKELVTFLGSYTELKHDTILYAKQVYAEMGGGPEIAEVDDRGYVEPNPELYNRLKSLIRLTIEGLSQRDLLSEENKATLKILEDMMKTLRDISIKELQNEKLTDEEYEFIRTYGGSLEHLFTQTLSEMDKLKERREVLNGHPSSIVADIATDPNGYVLEEGVGPINKMLVVFPIEGKLHVAVGGVYSHYEFKWPLNDRLTDEKWRKILFPYAEPPFEKTIDFTPEIAEWQKPFTLKTNY